MKIVRRVMMLGVTACFLLGLCACGKADVRIDDDGVVTKLEVSVPRTVEKILADAEIKLGDGDEVSPALDAKVSEAQDIIISRKHTVSLTVDKKTREASMVGGTVGELLQQEGITLSEKQHVNYGLDESLKDGMEIKVSDSFDVEVLCDGKTYEQNTEAETVRDLLAELEINVGKDDRVTPGVEEAVTDGMKVVVNRVTFDTVVEKEAIAFETTYEDDASMPKGKEQTVTDGEEGEKEITYKVTYVDGAEESREKEGEKVTKEPVNKVVKVGTKEEEPVSNAQAPAGSGGRSVVEKKAYYDCNGSGHGYYEITYSDGSVEYEEF